MPATLRPLAVLAAACFATHAMSQPLPDVDALWDFTQPAVDALHMRAIVATDADAAQAFDRGALARAEASAQPAARRWRASLLHNIGYGLHQRGRFAEALDAFERALALRRESGDAGRVQVARWMVAWTLRALGRTDEALAAQQALERDHAAAGTADRHVFAELALLHRARGDAAEAARYEALRDAP